MKKTLLLFCTMLCSLIGYSQTLSTPSTSVTTGTTITVNGSGETSAAYFIAEQGDQVWTVPSGYNQYLTNLSITFTSATYYDRVAKTATKLQYKLINTSSVPITVTYRITMAVFDYDTGHSLPQKTQDIVVTVNPTPPPVGNDAQPGPFTKSDCGTGYQGSSVAYSIPANTYFATTKAAANQLAVNAGIAYANGHGSCTVAFYNAQVSAFYKKTNCAVGTTPQTTDVVYTVPYGKYTASTQAAADQLAQDDITANGQNYAYAHGFCYTLYARMEDHLVPPPPGTDVNNWHVSVDIWFYTNPANGYQVITAVNIPVTYSHTFTGRGGTTTTNTTVIANNVMSIHIEDRPIATNAAGDPPALPSPSALGYSLVPSPAYQIRP